MKSKKNILVALGLLIWLTSVLFACWLPSARATGNEPFLWAAVMSLIYFAALLLAIVLCSLSFSIETTTGCFHWRRLGRAAAVIAGTSALAWIIAPLVLQMIARLFMILHISIQSMVRLHLLPLGRICEASFGLPLAVLTISLMDRRANTS